MRGEVAPAQNIHLVRVREGEKEEGGREEKERLRRIFTE
jgi:hypothetical protein